MGWISTILLGDIGNRLDIEATEHDIVKLRKAQQNTTNKLYQKEQEVQALQEQLARHELAIQSLTRFLIEKGSIDKAELEAFIQKVDAEDGTVDGMVTK